jgi:hypothetical protein
MSKNLEILYRLFRLFTEASPNTRLMFMGSYSVMFRVCSVRSINVCMVVAITLSRPIYKIHNIHNNVQYERHGWRRWKDQ